MNTQKKRVLYIDDERHNLDAFRATFRRSFEVHVASSAAEGQEILNRVNIEVVISDQRMPGMTGVEFLEVVRSEYPQSVRMLLTGYTDADAMQDAINRAKVYSYIAKPWDSDALESMINQALLEAETQASASAAARNGSSAVVPAKPPQPKDELDELLEEYNSLWESWTNRSTLLSTKEVLALEYYRNHRDHSVFAKEVGVTKGDAYNTYQKAISKLRSTLNSYNAWIVARALEMQNRKEISGGDNVSAFLHTPLKELGVSRPLMMVLNSINCYKPADIIENTSVRELMGLRNFGQKKYDELIDLFNENNCAHLLRKE